MKVLLRNVARRLGYDIVRYRPDILTYVDAIPDLTDEEKKTISTVRPFTMTSLDRLIALVNAVTYIVKNRIPGDLAECGVWRGGSMMAVALTLLSLDDRSRSLYLYDTYDGMSPPTDEDKRSDGVSAEELLSHDEKGTGLWCYAGLDDVSANMLSTGYPKDLIHLVKGKVEDTIPRIHPRQLALLRLDTDWYESTRHELVHLYPLLSASGVLIIDDYGYWKGARKAVDEYFNEQRSPILLHRIDSTGRLVIKPAT
jgi:hypothetical protein